MRVDSISMTGNHGPHGRDGHAVPPADVKGTVFDEPGGGELHPHVVPLKLLATVFFALIGLTVLTVAVTYVDLGSLSLWVALLVAGMKATLVASIFMHLAYDRGSYALVFFASIAFVVLFIGVVLMDSHHYQADIIQGYAPLIKQP